MDESEPADIPANGEQALLAAVAEAEFVGRRGRDALLGLDILSADRGWELLLPLYIERQTGRAASLDRLCGLLPTTMVLRWISILSEKELVAWMPGSPPAEIALTAEGTAVLERYLRSQLALATAIAALR